MKHSRKVLVLALAPAALLSGTALALTRDLAELQPARLSFGRSVLNELTHGAYRDPFDELQERPYNLLFANIGRHANLGPWPGQQGSYTRYVNALIGNNGTANVDNDADSIQGALIRREAPGWAWGVAAALLAGSTDSSSADLTSTFADEDTLTGYEARGAAAHQLSERRVLGVGLRATAATNEITDRSFELGVGGFAGVEEYTEQRFAADVGMRTFLGPGASWEAGARVLLGAAERHESSTDLDDTGAVTGSLVFTDYEIDDLGLALHGGYNRQRAGGPGETEYRGGLEYARRELGNSNLSYSQAGSVITPTVTLTGQDPLTTLRLYAAARRVLQAGETEMFAGAEAGYGATDGSTQIDAAGTPVNETLDDSQFDLGLTLGLRQGLFHDKLRFVVSGRADVVNREARTVFDTASTADSSRLSTAQYAVGLEGVLANVNFDVAWLSGEEAPVVPIALGLPAGSRRTVELDRLVFSAAVAW